MEDTPVANVMAMRIRGLPLSVMKNSLLKQECLTLKLACMMDCAEKIRVKFVTVL